MKKPVVQFTDNAADRALIRKISLRAVSLEMTRTEGERKSLEMDICACHSNGNPLRLADLLDAKPFDFIHDVGGIRKHIDRRTGQLKNCFLPRFHQREAA